MKNNTTKTVFATRIAKSIAAGQADCVIPLGTAELRTKYNRKFLKYIKVDELFDLCGGSVTTAYDITVDGFAFWAGVQATELNGYLYRHRLRFRFRCWSANSRCRILHWQTVRWKRTA